MKTFLAGFANVDSGKCAPTPMAGDQVVGYFFGKGDLKPKQEAKINAFLDSARVGDWQAFEGFGFSKDTTLTLSCVRSFQPGTVN